MDETIQTLVEYDLDIPFKEFTAGQVIQSKQFNDDMKDIEDKINEVITKYNIVVKSYNSHISNYDNPHQVTAPQVGAYTISEIDAYVEDLKNGNFNDNSISNRVLGNDCVESRNVRNGSITAIKVEEDFGNQLNISNNIDIINRYTKDETDSIIKSKVGDGTYTKTEIDDKLGQVQAGQIVDYTIGINQLKTDVGSQLDLSLNSNILNRYTKSEVDELVKYNGFPKDWGGITENAEYPDISVYGELPVANVMTCGLFKSSLLPVLDIDVAEVVDSRGTYDSLSARINLIESALDSIITKFSEVVNNG